MKKNLNVIQIRGFRGLIIAGLVVTCLAAGFIGFPGLVSMYVWNWIASYSLNIPTIGLVQGILLWSILVVSYFVFRKEKVVVCVKSPKGLSEEELKAVFADIKKQSMEDSILQAMMKARETELKLQTPSSEQPPAEQEQMTNTDSTKV